MLYLPYLIIQRQKAYTHSFASWIALTHAKWDGCGNSWRYTSRSALQTFGYRCQISIHWKQALEVWVFSKVVRNSRPIVGGLSLLLPALSCKLRYWLRLDNTTPKPIDGGAFFTFCGSYNAGFDLARRRKKVTFFIVLSFYIFENVSQEPRLSKL